MPDNKLVTTSLDEELVAKYTAKKLGIPPAEATQDQPVNDPGTDLSQDSENNKQQSVQDTIAYQESADRRSMQLTLFNSAIMLSILMFVFAGILAIAIVTKDSNKLDWHLPLLAAAFVVPPTLILIAIIRAIYPSSAKSDDKDNLPALNLVKEIAVAIKEAAKAVKG
jgi:hypothetical protein